MNKRQEVIQAIRTKLPRLMELEKGCIVRLRDKSNNTGTDGVYEFLGKTKHDHIVMYEDKSEQVKFSKRVRVDGIEDYIFEEHYEIIGKEPTILDLIVALRLTLNHDIETKSDEDEMTITNLDKGFLVLDLSKPNIVDQSEETINFLHSVLCEN